jgi:hypothetical protein
MRKIKQIYNILPNKNIDYGKYSKLKKRFDKLRVPNIKTSNDQFKYTSTNRNESLYNAIGKSFDTNTFSSGVLDIYQSKKNKINEDKVKLLKSETTSKHYNN